MQYDLFTGKQFKVVWLRVVCQFPRRDNPSLIIEVHDHELKQVILRLQDENGIDVEKKYRADVKKKQVFGAVSDK